MFELTLFPYCLFVPKATRNKTRIQFIRTCCTSSTFQSQHHIRPTTHCATVPFVRRRSRKQHAIFAKRQWQYHCYLWWNALFEKDVQHPWGIVWSCVSSFFDLVDLAQNRGTRLCFVPKRSPQSERNVGTIGNGIFTRTNHRVHALHQTFQTI